MEHFRYDEFDSPDDPGSGVLMHTGFLSLLDKLRKKVGRPFVITSGYRTKAHNKAVKGYATSSHMEGRAADIAVPDSAFRFALLEAAIAIGITRIGIGSDFIHLDVSLDKPQGVVWGYK